MTSSNHNSVGAIEFKLQRNKNNKYRIFPRYAILLFPWLMFLCVTNNDNNRTRNNIKLINH